MNIVGRKLSLSEFEQYVSSFNFGKVPPTMLVVHHTWKPTKQDWKGEPSLLGLKKYYEGLGWPAGPHLFVAEDGIWLFTPMSEIGIHAGMGNATWTLFGKEYKGYKGPWGAKLKSCSLGIEVVGNYDAEKWTGETLKNAVGVIKILKNKLNIPTEDILFHRDFPDAKKSCPGWAITKEWLGQQLLETKPECLNCPVHCK